MNLSNVKLDKRLKYILVIDIETANFIDDAIAYDIGYAVADKKGNIYFQDSLMLAEMFIDNKDLLQSAYYKEKIPNYWLDYKRGRRRLVTLSTAKREINKVMQYFNISDVFAYNARFDYCGLNRTERYITKSKYRYFFPYGTKVHCILKMARQVLFTQKNFKKFAEKNNLKTASGKFYSNTAETAWKYITNNLDFTESHTGLEDVKIECEIMAKCFRQHKKMDTLLW
jgi:hypothetical protein